MSESPVAGLVRAWVDLYTRGLPAELRSARRDEVVDDLWCEQEEAASLGRSSGAVSTDIALRLLLGMPADIGWRLTYRGTPRPVLGRRLTMNTRPLGAMALVAGLCWALMLTTYVILGDAIWTGGLGGLTVLITLAGAFLFPLTATSLAYQVHDRFTSVSAVAAGVTIFGALASLAGSTQVVLLVLLPLGSAILLWQATSAGVVSRLVPIAQAATAVALAVGAIAGIPLGGASSVRATTALIFAPFVLSWLMLGMSLIRRPQPESVERGSTA